MLGYSLVPSQDRGLEQQLSKWKPVTSPTLLLMETSYLTNSLSGGLVTGFTLLTSCFLSPLLLSSHPQLSYFLSPLLLQKKVVEQLRKELLVKQEPDAKLQLHVQTPPAGGDMKPGNLLQSQQIPGGLQQVGRTHTIYTCIHL